MALVNGAAPADPSPADAVFAWMNDPKTNGCLFAGLLAKPKNRRRWEPHVVGSPAGLSLTVRHVLPARPDKAFLLIFPTLSGPEGVRELLEWLAAAPQDGWSVNVVNDICPHAPLGASGAQCTPWGVHLTLRDTVVTEVLGMADIPTMPPTRRTKHITLAFQNGPPRTQPRKRPDVNLCDIWLEKHNRESFDQLVTSTGPFRTNALQRTGYPEGAAKARMTFML